MLMNGFEVNDGELVAYHGNDRYVEIPPGTTHVLPKAFLNCTVIEEVIMPDTVVSIGHHAFFGCSNLERIDLPAVKSIGNHAFCECSNLIDISVAAELDSIGECAFTDTRWFKEKVDFVILGGILLGYNGAANRLEIPNGVTRVAKHALRHYIGDIELKAVLCPDSLNVIEDYAFAGQDELAEVDLAKVKHIGCGAFHFCRKLARLMGGEDIEYVGAEAFKKTAWLEKSSEAVLGHVLVSYSRDAELKLQHHIHRIATGACSNLRQDELVLPETLTCVDSRAFTFCQFDKIKIGNHHVLNRAAIESSLVEEIDTTIAAFGSVFSAFSKIDGLRRVKVDHKETQFSQFLDIRERTIRALADPSIDVNACSDSCFVIDDREAARFERSVAYPDGNKKIKTIVFDIQDPATCPFWKINQRIAERFPNVDTFAVSDRMRQRKEYLATEGNLCSIEGEGLSLVAVPPARSGIYDFPECVVSVSWFAFCRTGITEVQLPPTLRHLDESAFFCCENLTEIRILSGVSYIGDQGNESPFVGCRNLKRVVVDIGNEAYFSNNNRLYRKDGYVLFDPAASDDVDD